MVRFALVVKMADRFCSWFGLSIIIFWKLLSPKDGKLQQKWIRFVFQTFILWIIFQEHWTRLAHSQVNIHQLWMDHTGICASEPHDPNTQNSVAGKVLSGLTIFRTFAFLLLRRKLFIVHADFCCHWIKAALTFRMFSVIMDALVLNQHHSHNPGEEQPPRYFCWRQ